MANSKPITVLYFAAAQSATGITSETIQLPAGGSGKNPDFPLSDLPELLVARHGAKGQDLAKVLQISKWSIDAEMVDDIHATRLKGGEEVAVIPPVSGG
jgi:molybdopterin converting factor small subunit